MKNYEFLAQRIYNQKVINNITKKIKLLGKDNKITAVDFLYTRTISSVFIFILLIVLFKLGYIIAPIITLIWYLLFTKVLLDDKIKKRTKKLEKEAMNFFEILTLSLETGRNLEEAIRITTNNIDSELSNIFKSSLREMSFGKSLTESLKDTQDKIPSSNINNIILSLTESNIYGNSIIETLNNQVEYLREKRKMEVKAEIAKAPIKISVISVLFFVPLILLLVLSPILLSYLN